MGGLTQFTSSLFFLMEKQLACMLSILSDIHSVFSQIYNHNLQALMVMSVLDRGDKLISRLRAELKSWKSFQIHKPADPHFCFCFGFKKTGFVVWSWLPLDPSVLASAVKSRSNLLLQRSRLHVRQYQDEVDVTHTMSVRLYASLNQVYL